MNCPSCQADNVEGARFCAKCGAVLPMHVEEEKDNLIGQKVGGRYLIKKVLGEGGMGRVYEAERGIAGVTQRIAVKTLHQHLSKDPQVVARFNRECATVAGLKHPNTIKVEDFGQTDDGTLYIAMEFVEGPSVSKELETNGPMTTERVERIMSQVCGALAEAHKQGIIHRDLKPENIVLTNVGDDLDVVKVLDFGIAARKESADAKKEQKLTQAGMVLGTPPYMSPEQFMGKELDARSDIYSLGVMVYEMLTGKLPFEANTPWEWATKHMTAQPFPIEDQPTVSDVPGKMKTAIARALSKNPDERQKTVREFFEDLASGGNIRSATSTHDVHQGAQVAAAGGPGATATMSPYEENKGQTQVGAPAPALDTPVNYSQPEVPAVVPPPPVMPPPTTQGGGNKGVLIGIAAVVGVGLLASLGLTAKHFMSSNGPNGTLDPYAGASGGTASVAPLPPGSVAGLPTSKPTTTTPTGVGPATTPTTTASSKPNVPTLSGQEACDDANRRAGNGDIPGAIASWRNCSGPGKDGSRRTIAAAVPGAVKNAGNRGDCKGARNIASMGGQVGANVNVDQTVPSCKGK